MFTLCFRFNKSCKLKHHFSDNFQNIEVANEKWRLSSDLKGDPKLLQLSPSAFITSVLNKNNT